MSVSQIVELIDRYFLDLIGTVVPGIVLIVGVCTVANAYLPIWIQPLTLERILSDPEFSFQTLLILIAVGYIFGHFLVSFSEHVVIKFVVDPLVRIFSSIKIVRRILPETMEGQSKLIKGIEDGGLFKSFKQVASKELGIEPENASQMKFKDWRNIALSISKQESYLSTRFMFISLLNQNTATALLIVATLNTMFFIIERFDVQLIAHSLTTSLVLILFSFFLLERRYSFYRRSYSTPFSLGIGRLKKIATQESGEKGKVNS